MMMVAHDCFSLEEEKKENIFLKIISIIKIMWY